MPTRPRIRLAAVLLALAGSAAACGSPEKTIEIGRSTIVTEENRLSRTHEAPSLLVDRNNPDAVYLAEVEL